jgi:glutamate-1-semialdehyde 2,1-aminomutase
MLDRGVLFHPGAFENLFVSFAHTEADIDQTLAAAKETARTIRAKA